MGKRGSSGSGSIGAIVFTMALLAVTLGLLFATRDLRPSAAVVPRLVAIPLAALLAYRAIREIIARRLRVRESPAAGEERPDELGAFVWLLALPAAATLLGFIVGPAVWVVAWMRFRARERRVVAIVAGAITAVAVIGLFSGLLGVSLPAGVFGSFG